MSSGTAPRPTAVVTGASAGIGEATARLLAGDGWHVVVGARRTDRVEALAADIDGTARHLDVSDPASVEAFCSAIDSCRLLVNNAGGALGVEPLAEAVDEKWSAMYPGRWAASLPSHVNVDSIVVKPRAQADAFRTHREGR